MHSFPVFLVGLERRRAVVIGGDAAAATKVRELADAGFGRIDVIAPDPVRAVRARIDGRRIRWFQRPYRTGDLDGATLAIATEIDVELNRRVARDSARSGTLLNAMDDPPRCDWFAGSVVRRGDLAIAIGTGGAAPALAVRLRERIEAIFPGGLDRLLALAGRLRPIVRRRIGDASRRRKFWYRLVDGQLARLDRPAPMLGSTQLGIDTLMSGDGGAA